MAGFSTKTARVDVYIGGADKAKEEMAKMETEAKNLRERIVDIRNAMDAFTKSASESSDWRPYEKLKDELDGATKQLRTLTKAINATKADIKTVEDVLGNISGSTLAELKKSRSSINQWLNSLDPTTQVAKIKDLNQKLREVMDEIAHRKESLKEFSDVMGDIGNASDKSLSMVKTRLQDLIASTEQNEKKLADYRDQLKQVEQEQQNRQSSKAGAVMGNLSGSSVDEIREAVKITEQLRDAQKLGSAEWGIYAEEITKANQYLKDFDALQKDVAMDDRMKSLATLSADALEETRKYWQAQVSGAKEGSSELDEYKRKMQEVIAEQQNRQKNQAESVLGNLDNSSVSEIQDAVKLFEQLRDTQARGSAEWTEYSNKIKQAKEYLDMHNQADQIAAITNKMSSLGTQSKASLEELKKFWQAQVNGATNGSRELDEYRQKLKQVEQEQQTRTVDAGQQIMSDVQSGTFSGTINETEEAIKKLKEFRGELDAMDTKSIKDVDDAIQTLSDRLKEASQNLPNQNDLDSITKKLEDLGNGSYSGTLEELQQMKKTLEEYKQKVESVGNGTGLDKLNEQIHAIEAAMGKANMSGGKLEELFKKGLKHATMNELKDAAAALHAELENIGIDTDDYIRKTAKLRAIEDKIKGINSEWEAQDASILKSIKRLTNYVLIYKGFDLIKDNIGGVIKKNLELSDSLGDIRKVTGLSAESIAQLSKEIDLIDTRTSQQELHDLAYEAGKLGVGGTEELLGFVKAGNQVIVALGEELGGAEAVRSLMKVNAVLGETKKLGVEKSLLATGSAINEISNKTRASAGPIADIVTRIGAIGKTAHLSMPDLVALAGTADALGQSAEVSGTALNKFISAVVSNTSSVGYAVGISEDHLKQLIDEGNTIQAVLEVLQKMGTKGLDEIVGMLGDLGGEGERVKQVLTTLAGGVDELEVQIGLSKRGFSEATSVTKEYNVKNETAQAILERLGNTIKEKFINSDLVAWLTKVLEYISSIPKKIERGEAGIRTAIALLQPLLTAVIAFSKPVRTLSDQIKLFYREVKYATTSVEGFTLSMKGLWESIKKNPLGILITVLTTAYTMYELFRERVLAAAEANAEFSIQTAKVQRELSALQHTIDSTKEGTVKHRQAIQELNSKYGTYLGFMVTEENYARNQAYIYKVLNARLKENLAIKMKSQMMEKTIEKYSDKLSDRTKDASTDLQKISKIGETNVSSAMDAVVEVIENNIDKTNGQILPMIKERLSNMFNITAKSPDSRALESAGWNLRKLVDTYRDINEETTSVSRFLDAAAKSYRKEADKAMASDLNKNVTPNVSKTTDVAEAKEYLEKYQQALQQKQSELQELEYRKRLLTEDGKNLSKTEQEELERCKKDIANISKGITAAEARIKKLGGKSPYSTSLELESASVDTLVGQYKALEKQMKRLGDDTDYKGAFASRGYKSSSEEYSALKKQEDDIKKVLKDKYGRNEHGEWIKNTGGGSSKVKNEMKEEIDGALSALDEYFVRRETAIKEARAKEVITEEEMNRQVENNEFEHLSQRVKLRNSFLKQGDQLSEDELNRYGMTKESMNKLSNFLTSKGKAMMDGIKKNQAEDLLDIQNRLLKHKKAIESLLLEDDYTGKVDKEYRDSIDKLELLFGSFEEKSEDLAKTRMSTLREYAKDAYRIDAEQLRKRMEANGAFGEWMKNRTAEDYEALLVILRKYGDDMEEAQNKQAQRVKTIADKKWTKSGSKTDTEAVIKTQENNVSMTSSLKDLGLSTEGMVDDEELTLYKLKMEASRLYIEQLKAETAAKIEAAETAAMLAQSDLEMIKKEREEKGDSAWANADTQMAAESALADRRAELANLRAVSRQAEQEAQEDYAEKQQAYTDKEADITKRKMEVLKSYTDAIVDFSEQMGEAAFGEVSDRKEAAKQMLQTVMKLTKDLIMQKTTELIMTKLLNKQKEVSEQTTNATITTSSGTAMIAQMSGTIAKTGGDIAAGQASGAAKTIAELGWWGIPLVAVISAALSALMGLAMSKMSKAKEEVASATGVSSSQSRVAAGMLTYAEGDYPVLGNDGQIYNAKYQKELKTGVYGGGAHFGIFSEKKPEMIVDGNTTERLILNYPHIYDAILTIAKNGRIRNAAMPTYASGSYPVSSVGSDASSAGAVGVSASADMANALSAMTSTMEALNRKLEQPISAYVNPYGDNGAVKQMEKANKFMKRRGLN